MTTTKHVEELMKEIDEKFGWFFDNQTDESLKKTTTQNDIKSFLLHAYTEGYTAGLEKSVEKVERIADLYKKAEFGLDDEILRHITSHLTQLITSNNEEKK